VASLIGSSKTAILDFLLYDLTRLILCFFLMRFMKKDNTTSLPVPPGVKNGHDRDSLFFLRY